MVGISDERQDELEHTPWREKLRSKAAWADAAGYTMADITMLRKELVIGYTVAGLLAVVVLISGFILYDTSNVLHHYRTDQHVAAALALFSSIAILFWYVLQIIMQSRD